MSCDETHFLKFPQLDKDTEDLEQDLRDVVKKVHLRIILKEHVKLKTLKLPELHMHLHRVHQWRVSPEQWWNLQCCS